MSSQSSPNHCRTTQSTPDGIAVSGRVTQRPRVRNAEESFNHSTSFEEGFSICAFGDLSMSEAYNVPAPTTGEYPLKLKRTRPPKPKRLQLSRGEEGVTSNLLQQLCRPSLNEYPLSPGSDFKRFVEGLQSTKPSSSFYPESAKTTKKTQAGISTGNKLPSSQSRAVVPSFANSTSIVSKGKAGSTNVAA
ncbi:hypothetical protein BDY19DRAFT_956077 [Irpex rosettiformis]|uniref:Uncharacterized protein n=1 Tax=Irpex rosettiformis TaxID=378272 RepID=A0ACB8TYC8_9APHY|nr:hypothetical protein BDY19DRAFT_956077 [Irpex rosettiformis]